MKIEKSEKLDDKTIRVTFEKPVPVQTTSLNVTLVDMLRQEAAILAQQARDNAQREAELADVRLLIAECRVAGLPEPTEDELRGVL